MKTGDSFGRAMAAFALLAVAASTAAVAQPTKSYKDPVTGVDCVQDVGDERTSDGRYVIYKYRNSCGLTFSIWWESRSGKKWSTGISPYGQSSHTIPAEHSDGQWWVD